MSPENREQQNDTVGSAFLKDSSGEFSGGPLFRTLGFHCRGHGFDSWLGNKDPASLAAWPK